MKHLLILFTCITMVSIMYSQNYRIIVGTYTRATESKGIYTLSVNPSAKTFTILDTASQVENPSFLALLGDKLYAVGEGSGVATANAFHLDKQTAKLQYINTLSGIGNGPCSVTASERHVMIANYGSGNLNVFSLNSDGSLNKFVQNIQHQGGSVDPQRQKGPHAHQVIFNPAGSYLFSNNLGTDLLYAYRYCRIIPQPLEAVDSILMENGGGPRHLAVSADGEYLYVLQELTGTISIVQFKDEKLTLVGQSSVIKKPGKAGAADIHLSPDGKFLYATNRIDYNDITAFQLKSPSELIYIDQYSTSGIAPRNFMITRDGKYVFVGNQRSNEIVVFKRNLRNGKLKDTGFRIPVPAPVCHLEF